MDELAKRAQILDGQINQAITKLDISSLEQELSKLQKDSQTPDFWQDSSSAQDVMRQISKLQTRTGPWHEITKSNNEAAELIKLGDSSMRAELENQLDKIQARFDALKKELKFNGIFDAHDTILSLHAGAGGHRRPGLDTNVAQNVHQIF